MEKASWSEAVGEDRKKHSVFSRLSELEKLLDQVNSNFSDLELKLSNYLMSAPISGENLEKDISFGSPALQSIERLDKKLYALQSNIQGLSSRLEV